MKSSMVVSERLYDISYDDYDDDDSYDDDNDTSFDDADYYDDHYGDDQIRQQYDDQMANAI